MKINVTRLLDRIRALGEIGALEGGGACRLAFSDEDKAGRDLVVSWMKSLDLDVTIDQMGNIFARRTGRQNGPSVMTGSHIDTVRTGGLYDGVLGVLAGLEIVETLNENNLQTEHPLTIAIFSNEEGVRFSPDMMGSLVFVGGLSAAEAYKIDGIDNVTVGQSLESIGYDGKAQCGGTAVRAFVEIHVEQGPVLEKEGLTIGAVEKVQGISWQEFSVRGESNHAGTTPIRLRHDAGYAASLIACQARKIAEQMGGDQVATVGVMNFKPNLVNVIPNRVSFTVDLRNTDELLLQSAEQQLATYIGKVSQQQGVDIKQRVLARFEPVDFSPSIVNRVEQAAQDQGHSVKRMPSGAGHDAQMLARICPAGMVFVPSVGGISHNIKEHTDKSDIEAGVNVLLSVLVDLLNEREEPRS